MELELRKLGLSEKEAKLYLAGLELGPSSVQKISQATSLTRPTTYEIIKKLESKGLFHETKENKKRYFEAQSPESVLGILKTQRKELDEKEREFIRIISALESRYAGDKNEIKIYKGKEGLNALLEIISFADSSEFIAVNPQKKLNSVFLKIKKRLGKLNLKEIELDIKGTLILFDKAVFLPKNKKQDEPQGYLLQNPVVIKLLKSLVESKFSL